MSPKYKVGDFLFYKDRWGTMMIEILSIDDIRGAYNTTVIRNELGKLGVVYYFKNLDKSERVRLATRAERILLCK